MNSRNNRQDTKYKQLITACYQGKLVETSKRLTLAIQYNGIVLMPKCIQLTNIVLLASLSSLVATVTVKHFGLVAALFLWGRRERGRCMSRFVSMYGVF